MNYLFRMRELIEQINNADKAYFGEDKPIMTDKEYDALVEELTKIEKETGIHFKNSPQWTLHPFFSKNVNFFDVTERRLTQLVNLSLGLD